MADESTNNAAHLPNFCERVFARPHLDGEDPAVSSARRMLEECQASKPDEFEVWERYGGLQAAVQGLLDLVRGQAGE
ncbi:hypothetical protein GCM10023191_092460 [Actinoallomurus oryzae]|uniref:Uncharacterized protein n=1 Tax=Actinoallomurus oryzae TaxID=502180 RepID=A0ABP8R513_9ACTN